MSRLEKSFRRFKTLWGHSETEKTDSDKQKSLSDEPKRGVVIRLCKLNLLRGKALMAPLKLSPEGGDKKVRFT
ncbi:MAG: hypothetical protein IT220_10880 [Flavobacteriaceae bacterium]|nr:hypothetical protein [Flavobacteriaceae bacterium]